MQSWQILREAVEQVGAKTLAAKLRVSAALIYKWSQETGPRGTGSGALNPLDRVRSILEITGDTRIVRWLCQAAGGFFVESPQLDRLNQGAGLLASTQRVIEEFSKVLSTISRSIENDGQITPDESDRIRQSWEELKSCGERFVVACERGAYAERSSSADGTQPAQSWSVGGG
ncbi:MAG: hypothetical protein KBH81_03480 [Phycisphaerae bacterium]|jgi:hypothetical protein|nr:hypothetical protein [Phycisphaerae bacterium]HPC21257.1 hypothetical protein [Phycisphaerae bacterium]HRS27693.1 hypothetical protein [Phycisphaerae bacterium]